MNKKVIDILKYISETSRKMHKIAKESKPGGFNEAIAVASFLNVSQAATEALGILCEEE